MIATRRPVSVLAVAFLFLAVGIIGFVFHFGQLPRLDGVWIEITEALAILAGGFMLRGRNWARWLALAWMAFHVGLSAFGAVQELVIHCAIFAGIVWLLFRADSRSYFRRSKEAQA